MVLWQGGWTALMFAAKSGHAEVVATLCKGGADAEMKNNVSPEPVRSLCFCRGMCWW